MTSDGVPAEPQPAGHIDAPGAGAELERGVLTVRGWALFPAGPTARVELLLGERPLGRAQLGIPRPDLAAIFEAPQAAIAGFSLTADVGAWPLADGEETALRAVATSVAGETLELPPATLRLTPPARSDSGHRRVPPVAARERRGRPRVLVCTHQLCLGGASRYLLELLGELLRQEAADPLVLSPIGGPSREPIEALGIPVHLTSAVPIDDAELHEMRLDELAAWAGPQGFDVAFVNTASPLSVAGAELAGRLGIPAVWAIHESFDPAVLWAACSPAVCDRAAAALGEAALAIFEAAATQRIWEPLAPGRCLTLPYGLELGPIDAMRAGFDRAEARSRLGLPADAEVLICSGTVEARKAQVPLAQAFDLVAERHPRAMLVLAGATENEDSRALAQLLRSARHGDRVRLVETTPDIHSWYGASDILVTASHVESLPRAALEAMAWEMPVLATSVFGLPELVEDGVTGWLCEPGDTAALSAALERALASDPAERRRMGEEGRRVVERRHDIEPYAREVARLLERAAAGELSASR